MPYYTVTGKSVQGSPIASVAISAIDQDIHVFDDMVIINAIRDVLAAATGVVSVQAQKYEQVITVV